MKVNVKLPGRTSQFYTNDTDEKGLRKRDI